MNTTTDGGYIVTIRVAGPLETKKTLKSRKEALNYIKGYHKARFFYHDNHYANLE